jgi:hypothetical protein
MKPKTPAAGFHSDLDKSVDNLDDLSIHGSATRTEESASGMTSSSTATTFLGLGRTRVADHDSVYAILPSYLQEPAGLLGSILKAQAK